MSAETMTLTDFLLARVAEDEAWVVANGDCPCEDAERFGAPKPTCADRIAAECEAKRQIVGIHARDSEGVYDADGIEHPGHGCHGCWDDFPCATVRALASVYAGHADYRPEWRPDA